MILHHGRNILSVSDLRQRVLEKKMSWLYTQLRINFGIQAHALSLGQDSKPTHLRLPFPLHIMTAPSDI